MIRTPFMFNTSRFAHTKGATLIELLVSIGILGILTILIVGVFGTTGRTNRREMSKFVRAQQVQLITEQITKDISSAFAYKGGDGSAYFSGKNGFQGNYNSDKIGFVCARWKDESIKLEEISYRITVKENDLKDKYTVIERLSDDKIDGMYNQEKVHALGVSNQNTIIALNLRYMDKVSEKWVDEWPTSGGSRMPSAVEVTLGAVDNRFPYKSKIILTRIIPIMSRS
jgi:type II secretion system protein J